MATYAVSDLAIAPPRQPGSSGDTRRSVKLLTATGTYTTGGDAVTAAALGLTRVHYGVVNVHTPDADVGVTEGVLVPTATGVLVKLNAASAEATSGGTITGLILQVLAYGDA